MIDRFLEDLGDFYFQKKDDNNIDTFFDISNNSGDFILKPIFSLDKLNLIGYKAFELKKFSVDFQKRIDDAHKQLKEILISDSSLQVKNTAINMVMNFYKKEVEKENNLSNNIFKEFSLYGKKDLYCSFLDKKFGYDFENIVDNILEDLSRDKLENLFEDKYQKNNFFLGGFSSIDKLFNEKIYNVSSYYNSKYNGLGIKDTNEKKKLFKFSNPYTLHYDSNSKIVSGYFSLEDLNEKEYYDKNVA